MSWSRRFVLRAAGAVAASPAAAKAAEARDALSRLVSVSRDSLTGPQPDDGEYDGLGGERPKRPWHPEVRLGKMVARQIEREAGELRTRNEIRRLAYSLPLDPDIAGLKSCSTVYLRGLMEKRLWEEFQAEEELRWKLWPPAWMRPDDEE